MENRIRKIQITSLFVFLIVCSSCNTNKKAEKSSDSESKVSYWLTLANQSVLFEKQSETLQWSEETNDFASIEIDDSKTYQIMNGFGYTLTGGSAILMHKMSPTAKKALLEELFLSDGTNIGVNYLRVSIGASDLDPEPFTYAEGMNGQPDRNLTTFSLDEDRKYLIPILKEILELNPNIKILGSPWSPPVWMKDNKHSIGGSLKPEFYASYAQYFVKYIEGMHAEGIPIDAITIQNEPLHDGNNPSLYMPWEQQAIFIKTHLGLAFKKAKISTKIILYDHNCDKPEYPISILNDPDAKQYVDGSAFHLYGGDISALTKVHNAHPDKHLYFTEQYTSNKGEFASDLMWHMKYMHIDAPRNWSKNVLEWNLASDPEESIHTDGGCTVCLGAITIDGSEVSRNIAYYTVAHSAKFVRDGSVRIASNEIENIANVAYRTPTGEFVLVALNDSETAQKFNIQFKNQRVTCTMPSKSIATYVW